MFRELATRMLSRPRPGVLNGAEDIREWLSNMSLSQGATGRQGYRPAIVHHGLNEFVSVDARSPVNGGALIFRRHGLGWKLEEVRFGQQ
jgi:hypothetical protein